MPQDLGPKDHIMYLDKKNPEGSFAHLTLQMVLLNSVIEIFQVLRDYV